jgi:serine/threonine-protein kinase HipA
MAQLGHYDGDYEASYLEIAQFLTDHGGNTQEDLAQLWRRIVFNIAISNSDDHLRNHGFLLGDRGWHLSPAYDMNPVPTATHLHLAIDELDARMDFDVALRVIDLFQLTKDAALRIKREVINSVSHWRIEAKKVGLSRVQQDVMASAFRE